MAVTVSIVDMLKILNGVMRGRPVIQSTKRGGEVKKVIEFATEFRKANKKKYTPFFLVPKRCELVRESMGLVGYLMFPVVVVRLGVVHGCAALLAVKL